MVRSLLNFVTEIFFVLLAKYWLIVLECDRKKYYGLIAPGTVHLALFIKPFCHKFVFWGQS